MQITNGELRGRVMVLELLLPIALTRIAEIAPDPAAFLRGVMGNAEDMIERVEAAAAGEAEREAANAARAAFEEISDAMAQHLTQRGHKPGNS